MQAVFIYILKACIYSGILFLYYFIALRNKQFHYYNRFYLLMTVALSLILPFVNLEVWTWQSNNSQVIQLMNVVWTDSNEAISERSDFTFSPEVMAFIATTFTAFCLLIVLAFSIIKIIRFKRTYPSEKIDNIHFINTDLTQAPFSFFNNLFWKNSLTLSDTTGKQILRHEMTHIQQKHSWDKVFMRIVTSIFWLNPFYWMIQKELSLIHEFIADEKAIENKDAEAFALMLLQSQYSKTIFSPAQSFNYSPIKRRLRMLTTSKKTSFSYARRIMILPLLAATVLLFAFKLTQNKTTEATAHVNAPFTLVVDAGHGGKEDGAIGINDVVEKGINLNIAKRIQDLAPQYGITVVMTRTEDETVSLQQRMDIVTNNHPDAFVSIHVMNTEEKETNKNDVEVYISRNETSKNYQQSRLLSSGLLQAVKADFPINDAVMQRKEKGIYVLDFNPYPAALIECGYMNNADNLKQLMNADYVEKMSKDILQGIVAYANADKTNASISITDTTAKPLYIVDGKEISDDEMKKIDANKIESINVLKDSSAIKKYGQEKGKNGVVLITMKKASSNNAADSSKGLTTQDIIRNSSKSDLENKLLLVDGKEVTKEEFTKVAADEIESISVWKDQPAVNKFGEKGRNGVIEIKTKRSKKDSSSNTSIDLKSKTVNFPSDNLTIRADTSSMKVDKNAMPLILINGEEKTKADMDNLSQNQIESVNVWKGNDAIKKFGNRGKNGVIDVKTKNNKSAETYLPATIIKDSSAVDNIKNGYEPEK